MKVLRGLKGLRLRLSLFQPRHRKLGKGAKGFCMGWGRLWTHCASGTITQGKHYSGRHLACEKDTGREESVCVCVCMCMCVCGAVTSISIWKHRFFLSLQRSRARQMSARPASTTWPSSLSHPIWAEGTLWSLSQGARESIVTHIHKYTRAHTHTG